MLKIAQRLAVTTLAADQLQIVWRDYTRRHPDFPQPTAEPSPDQLADLLAARRVDHASLLSPMFRETAPLAVAAIEHLLGKPITRPSTRRHASATFNGRAPRVRPTDDRVITEVVSNPKKPNSASFERFAKYRVGMTVSEALAAGVQPGDIKWDSERGFIRCG